MKLIRSEKFVERPACVLLDLDNTLYPYRPSHEAGMAAARELAHRSLGLATVDFDRCFDNARAELKARLGDQAASHHRLLYFQRTLERAGLATRPIEALQLEQIYWSHYLDAMVLFPNALEFLDDLRLADVPAVIVTDLTAQIQLRKMVATGLDHYVDWVVTSEESGHDKPHRAGFELALAKLGGIEGAIWMVGDNHACDLIGARDALGATTIQKLDDGASGADCAAADAQFTRFSELRKLFAKTAAI